MKSCLADVMVLILKIEKSLKENSEAFKKEVGEYNNEDQLKEDKSNMELGRYETRHN